MSALLSLRSYLYRYRVAILGGFFFLIAANIVALIQPYLIRLAVDSLHSGADFGLLLRYGLLIVGVSLVQVTLQFCGRYPPARMSRRIEYELRADLFKHFEKLELDYFQHNKVGDLVARATNDLSAIRGFLGPGISNLMNTVIAFTVSAAFMLTIDAQLTFYAVSVLPLISIVFVVVARQIEHRYKSVQDQFGEVSARAQENLSGIRIVKAYTQEDKELQAFRDSNQEYVRRSISYARFQALLWPAMYFLAGLASVVLIWRGGLDVIEGRITLGQLVQFTGYLAQLTWPMIAFGWVVNLFQQGAASMQRINEVMNHQPTIADDGESIARSNGKAETLAGKQAVGPSAEPAERVSIPSRPLPQRSLRSAYQFLRPVPDLSRPTSRASDRLREIKILGDVEYRHVSFSYEEDGREILHDINIKVKAGSSLAIVGPTGSGKSTMVNVLPRLFDVTKGQVLIDGIDVQEIPLAHLRHQIGFVPQETFLFSIPLAENIGFGLEDLDTERLEEVMQIAQLAKDVEDFPQGVATMIGERGVTLSGGQKQRTALARAIARDPAILILDDAMSSVDTHTEADILKHLQRVMQGRTTIIISHRCSTVKNLDHIMVLDDGHIVEEGTHETLLYMGGLYAEMYRRQLLGEELEGTEDTDNGDLFSRR